MQRPLGNIVEVPLDLINNDVHWQRIFQKYDKDLDGYISLQELDNMFNSQDYDHDIPEYVVRKIHGLANTNRDGKIDMTEFVDMIHHPDLQHMFKDFINSYVRILLPRSRHISLLSRAAGQYEDEYTCCPPPVGMLAASIIILILYCIDDSKTDDFSMVGPVGKVLIYNPRLRYEIWRYITYMLVHIGSMHLTVNICVQVLLGIPLEMVHKWWRILVIYLSGVVAGSLGTSVTDPGVYLAGASGGVYAILTAHIASIILNWSEMQFPLVQLIIFLLITGCDLGTAVYNRYVLNVNNQVGYTAHLAGALAGLLVGINVLRNIEITKFEKVVWWTSIIIYTALMGAAIIWNLCFTSYFL